MVAFGSSKFCIIRQFQNGEVRLILSHNKNWEEVSLMTVNFVLVITQNKVKCYTEFYVMRSDIGFTLHINGMFHPLYKRLIFLPLVGLLCNYALDSLAFNSFP